MSPVVTLRLDVPCIHGQRGAALTWVCLMAACASALAADPAHRDAVVLEAARAADGAAVPVMPSAVSPDGRWRVEGRDGTVVVLDAGRVVKQLPARALAGGPLARVIVIHALPSRRSFVIAFDSLAELWELSVDPQAPPVYDGLVHDYRMGEAVASPGFLGVRRTLLDAPARALRVDAGREADLRVCIGDAWWRVNLDIRRAMHKVEETEPPSSQR